jgi:hypothetical protein
MRKLWLIFIIILPLCSEAQFTKHFSKMFYARCGTMFLAGACDGTAETLKFHYDRFKAVFPKANDQYWNENKSWGNKYANGACGKEKFWGSSTVFVWTTDGYHMMRFQRNLFIMTSMSFCIGEKKDKWYYYLIQLVANYACFTLGETFAMDVLWRE